MTTILFDATRPVKSDRTARFGQGVYIQKADRLPIGPDDADRAWAATALNADTTAYSTEDGDWQTHEARTVSRREWLELQTELATERFVAACDAISDRLEARREPEEAEVAEIGSQLGHEASPADPEPTYVPPPWAFVKDANHRTSEAYAAKYNAEKAERKAKEAAAAESILTPADIATLERLGMPMENGPAWTYSDEYLDGCDADRAARDATKKAARKPKALTLRQINRAARKAAKG